MREHSDNDYILGDPIGWPMASFHSTSTCSRLGLNDSGRNYSIGHFDFFLHVRIYFSEFLLVWLKLPLNKTPLLLTILSVKQFCDLWQI